MDPINCGTINKIITKDNFNKSCLNFHVKEMDEILKEHKLSRHEYKKALAENYLSNPNNIRNKKCIPPPLLGDHTIYHFNANSSDSRKIIRKIDNNINMYTFVKLSDAGNYPCTPYEEIYNIKVLEDKYDNYCYENLFNKKNEKYELVNKYNFTKSKSFVILLIILLITIILLLMSVIPPSILFSGECNESNWCIFICLFSIMTLVPVDTIMAAISLLIVIKPIYQIIISWNKFRKYYDLLGNNFVGYCELRRN